MFNNKKAEIFNSVSSSDFPLFKYAKKASDVCITLFILSVLYLGYSLISRVSFDSALRLNIFFFVLTAVFWEIHLFFENSIKKPQLPKKLADVSGEDNLAEFLTLESAKIVSGALKFCRRKKISEVSSINLLYSALSSSFQTKYIFNRLGLEIERVQDLLKNSLEKSARGESTANVFSEDFNSAMSVALATAKARLHERIEARDILVGISGAEFFKQILIEASLKEDDFANLSVWYDYLEKKIENRKQFWSKDNLAMNGSIGKDWAAGYTVTLDQYSTDLTKYIRRWFYKAIIGHEKALERLQEALCRPQMNNALIVGDPGTGRESIIEGLARRVFLGKSLEEINYHRVIELDMSGLLSQVKTEDETTFVLDRIFSEVVSAGNVILVIKDFHNYVGLEINQPGMVDISGILSKYLSIFGFKFVGITDYTGLHERIEKNPALLSMFEKIEVSEITEAETIRILQNRALELEQKYKLFIIYPSIRELVNLAAKYIPNQPFPKKAINILEDVAIYVARSVKAKVVLPEHVAKVVSAKTEIPIAQADEKEKETLLNLEKLIHERIVNQEQAVKDIATAMRRARSGIGSSKRPMGTFLFLGPTGVGKTETSKALASIYFGGEEKMIRLDMSEFQAITDIPRLLGAKGQEGLLTTPIRENPFALVLLDEIEKAHPNILNLFLQVLDEGHITDGQGRKTVFTNTLIICTSNAGADMIFKAAEKAEAVDKDILLSSLFDKGMFRPEFINRFDATVIFNPLTQSNLLDICQLSLQSLQKRLKERGISFTITESLKKKIVELSYKPAYGAREMRRVIQDKVENVVADALLLDNIKRGDGFEISSEFKLLKNK